MGRLAWQYQAFCLFLFFMFVGFQVDCTASMASPFNSSSPNSTLSSHLKQRFALLQFKNDSFHGILLAQECDIKTSEWKEIEDCCSWVGVTCDKPMGNVIGLSVSASCLEGTIDHNSSLFHLSHLRQLNLETNFFRGSIPESIGSLTRLTELTLSGNEFSGQLPSSLSKLQHLTHLDLSGNMFAGQIPNIFGSLNKLSILSLYSNNFSEQLPPSIFDHRQLTDLSFSCNRLTGPLPDHLSGLSKLSSLDFSYNFLNGTIPSWLFTLPSLLYIHLENNKFTGFMDPFELPNSVTELYLGNNQMHGPIPSFISKLVNLTSLDLSSNNFSGDFDFKILSKLRKLEKLELSYNSILFYGFNGSLNHHPLKSLSLSSCNISKFPSFLSNLENLEMLELSNNKIRGSISKLESEGWKALTSLNLSYNFLTSIEQHPWKNISILDLHNNSIKSLVVPPPKTSVLLVSNNELTGRIPSSICNLNFLEYFDLSNNNLSGKIPQCFGNLSDGLAMLHLKSNNLHGRIPNMFSAHCGLNSLDLSGNKLEGPLPPSLGGCVYLEVLNVGNNQISDSFPSWLENLVYLKVLVLRYNRFHGPINKLKSIPPYSEMKILDLSHNEFTGYLSRTLFDNLTAAMDTKLEDILTVGVLSIGGEYYEDSLTVTMKGLEIEMERILTIFKSIDLSSNNFQGEIPKELGNMKLLIVLNLSYNSLTGSIPWSLGNLTALESLDLSSNKLDGRIPVQLEDLTFLEVLNLSHNNLSGPIPEGGQWTTFGPNSFIGNRGLCGKQLSVKCGKNEPPQYPPPVFFDEDDTGNGFSDWKIIMMGYGCGLMIGLSLGYIVFSTGKLQWLLSMVESKRRKRVGANQRRGR